MKLRIAEGLALPSDAVTQTFGILAKRGAGKSNAAAVLAEQMHAAGAQFVVVDPVGAWWGLRSSADGKGPGLSIAVLGGHHHDLPLDPGAGELVADLVVDERISCVLDVSAFDSESAKRRFLTAFANRLFRQKGRPGSGDPLHLFLEEADDYAPQMTGRGGDREQEGGKGACLGAFQRLVKQGRARGIGCTMITQRSAALNKDLLTQIETLIVLRTTAPNDRKAIEGWVKYHDLDGKILASLSELAVGEAWVWSPSWLGIVKRVQMPRRTTYDSGATATGSSKSKPVATLADVDLTALRARMAATIERQKADDPRELRKTIDSWKEWHRKLTSALGLGVVDRDVTLGEVRTLASAKPAAPKVERVEVPVVDPKFVARIEAAAEVITKRGHEMRSEVEAFQIAAAEVNARIQKVHGGVAERSMAPGLNPGGRVNRPAGSNPAPSATVRVSSPQTRGQNAHSNGSIPSGERKVLIAIAQHRDGVTREQLTVLTGYKRSSRDTYLQRLSASGYIITTDRILATNKGRDALGADFEPLPTGDSLLQYWMGRLPEGERRVLSIVVEHGPIEREAISEATGYKRSSRDTYLQRLSARQLVRIYRDGITASEELFS